MKKTYNVTIPVFETIKVSVMAENEEEAKELATEQAIKETPFVAWQIDEDAGIEVYEEWNPQYILILSKALKGLRIKQKP